MSRTPIGASSISDPHWEGFDPSTSFKSAQADHAASPFANPSDFFRESSLTYHGMLLIRHHRKDMPIHIARNYNELAVILAATAGTDSVYGIITIAPSDHHKTPILIKGDAMIILDSLGLKGGHAFELRDKILTIQPSARITCVSKLRQTSNSGCGSEAFEVLSEAIRLGESLFSFYKAVDDRFLPPTLTCYIQQTSMAIAALDESETYRRDLTRLSEESTKKLFAEISAIKEALCRSNSPTKSGRMNWNPTVDLIIEAHQSVIQSELKKLESDQQLFQILYAASPIPALRANPAKLSSLHALPEMQREMKSAFDVETHSSSGMRFFAYSKLGDYSYLEKKLTETQERLEEKIKQYFSLSTNRGHANLSEIAALIYVGHALKEKMKQYPVIATSTHPTLNRSA